MSNECIRVSTQNWPGPRNSTVFADSLTQLPWSQLISPAGGDHLIRYAAGRQGRPIHDALFVPDGFDQSFAGLGQDVKRRLSHCARALVQFKAYLRRWHDQRFNRKKTLLPVETLVTIVS